LSRLSEATVQELGPGPELGDTNVLPQDGAEHARLDDVAWIDEEQVAFLLYYRTARTPVGIYSLVEHEWVDSFEIPRSEDCKIAASWPYGIARLPDGRLGIAYFCGREDVFGGLIYALQVGTGGFDVLQDYEHWVMRPFAYSPDMSELVQEDGVGEMLNNELWRVRADGSMVELVPHFERARAPAWSPDGKLIAFAGTERYEREQSGEYLKWSEITSRVLFPWDLYLMDAITEETQILLTQIGSFGGLKWSPVDNSLLAFSGTLNDVPGVWIVNVETGQLTRVWTTRTAYDWSPDGSRIVLIVASDMHEEPNRAIIIDVPDLNE